MPASHPSGPVRQEFSLSDKSATKSGWYSRWRSAAGLDFHVLVTLMFRGWSIFAGAVTLLLLPLWLSPTQQGYYYTFASILALQIFFELGFNQIIVQLVSHEFAHLTFRSDGTLNGDAVRVSRLASLALLLRRWYGIAAILFAAGAGLAGASFFAHKGILKPSGWLGPWVLLVLASACNLFLSPGLAFMEGTGQIGQVARLRLLQSCAGYVCLWVALLLGAGLWATAATALVSATCTSWWLRARGHLLRRMAVMPFDAQHRMSWSLEIFPFQWRIAASWVGGYFIFNLFTPLVFSHGGAIEAGRLGLALTVFNSVSTVGMSWINAKNPRFTMHISRGERQDLNVLFRSVMWRSCGATGALSLFVVVAALVLTRAGVPAMSRIAQPSVLGCLAWVTAVNSAVFAMATYMRAHRQEPMLPVSVVTGVLTATVAYFGSRVGVLPMMLSYAAVTTFVTLPWTSVLFRCYYQRTT